MHLGQQCNLNKGLKKFRKSGKDAATKEIVHQHKRKCFEPIDTGKLSETERRKAQIGLTCLTEKRDGTIKGRTVHNG